MMIQALPHYPAAGDGGGGTINYVGGKSATYIGSGTTHDISLSDLTGGLDNQPAENDIVVVSVSTYATDTNLSVSGYTEHCDLYGSDRANHGVYTKIMGGSPDTSITVGATSSDTIVRIFAFRGMNTSTPLDVAAVTRTEDNSGQIIIPAITPVTSGAIIIASGCAQAGNVLNVGTPTNSGGYSTFLTSKSGRLCSCMGWKNWAGGADGPHDVSGATSSVSDQASCAIALRPA